jgi:VWFA-related protein
VDETLKGERMKTLYCVGAGLMGCAVMVSAQQPAAGVSGQAAPFVVASQANDQGERLVFDVIVTDKAGKLVKGLQEQDFTVLDNKQPTKILAFKEHNPPPLGPSQIDASTEIILVFDEVNSPLSRVIYARQGMQSYLRRNNGQLDHPVSLAFFTDTGLQVQKEPSLDGNALALALNEGQSVRAVENGDMDRGLGRLQKSQDALYSLIDRAKATPGRKMVIWVGPGWPLLSGFNDNLSPQQQQRIFSSVVRLSTEMRETRMVLYSIDTLGTFGSGTLRDNYYENFTKGLTRPDKAQLGDVGLQVLVTQTGGRVIFGNDSIVNSLDHCVEDLSGYYTVSIGAAPGEKPNTFHAIEVKLSSGGLKARTRDGYYAQP